MLAHLGDPVVVVSAPVDPVLEELDALEEVVLEGGGLARREDVHAGERRGDEVQPVVGKVQAVVLPLLDDVLEHLIITENTHTHEIKFVVIRTDPFLFLASDSCRNFPSTFVKAVST